jgi:septal ring factor EnvC (AmiA/AmiB activator)
LEGKEGELKTANDRVKFLEDTLLQREKELNDLDEDYTRVLDERMRFEKQYMETVTELNELKKQGKNNLLNKLVHFLHSLVKGK